MTSDVARALIAALRDHERREDHDAVHEQIVCRNVEPLQALRTSSARRMLLEEAIVVEPDDVVVVDVVAEVLVAHVLVGAVRGAADPAHEFAEACVVARAN